MAQKGKIIDFGKYGKMTITEAAAKYNVRRSTITNRIYNGIKKEKLIDGDDNRKARTFNCGRYGWLTAKEISDKTGLTSAAIHSRIHSDNFKLDAIVDGNYYGNIPRDTPDRHKYDCGKYGWLSTSEISNLANISIRNARDRVYIKKYKKETIIDGLYSQDKYMVDFGKYGKMRVSEAANKYKVRKGTIYFRIRKGCKKEELIDGM